MIAVARGARRRLERHQLILLGLLLGATAGTVANGILGADDPRLVWVVRELTDPVGQLFLRLLLMMVVPLVFASLVVGVAGIGDVRRLGRVGLKAFLYALAITGISVALGLTLVNVIRPGERIDEPTAAGLEERFGSAAARQVEASGVAAAPVPALTRVVQTLVPANPIAAIAADPPNLLHLMFFALALGIGATLLPLRDVAPFLGAMQGLYEITIRIIDGIMRIAPIAVACLLFSSTAGFGLDLLAALGWYVATVLLGLALHMFGVYSLSVYFLSRISPIEFFRRTRTALVTAFSTSSSSATLPTALRVSEENLGVPREINSFVLTVGATANQNGTALYEGVTVLFLAQLAGLQLPLEQQVVVAYLAVLGGIGTAGVPAGSIPFLVAILATIGVNPALIAIVLGVDRLLDMCRTTLNVAGDLTAATFVARSEGVRLLERPAVASPGEWPVERDASRGDQVPCEGPEPVL